MAGVAHADDHTDQRFVGHVAGSAQYLSSLRLRYECLAARQLQNRLIAQCDRGRATHSGFLCLLPCRVDLCLVIWCIGGAGPMGRGDQQGQDGKEAGREPEGPNRMGEHDDPRQRARVTARCRPSDRASFIYGDKDANSQSKIVAAAAGLMPFGGHPDQAGGARRVKPWWLKNGAAAGLSR
ncbi:MAG TPA: hypothetical protein VGV37_05280 [Aliidongia sp.]|uniref:hypothetical protein n=1 Tax=Aliidongia sp. TaxID=1914230 RepID=UPI002DDDBBE4|nr:hypothetical protein [Aliidongia sp.]HEV2673933.1 hypothetical protein [Aliidongia sp.]